MSSDLLDDPRTQRILDALANGNVRNAVDLSHATELELDLVEGILPMLVKAGAVLEDDHAGGPFYSRTDR